MNGFWNGWIVALTVANVAGALWLLFATSRRKPGEGDGSTTGHTWDGDLKEYNNPLPRWWLFLFYGTVVFAIGYVVVYPALGSYAGTAGWSQASQWQAQTDAANAAYAQKFARFDTMTVTQLQADADAMRIAKNLFGNNCAMCHGSDGRGAKGFPNLHAPNMQYGSDPDTVLATISGGRQGVMPAWHDALGDTGVEEVANYVYTLSGRPALDAAAAAAGKDKFASFCSACHGPDGTGNPALGAPNLTDSNWLYGGSIETIRETVTGGRTNQMPAHLDLLGEQKVKLLAAYVLSLRGAPAATSTGASASATPAPAGAPAASDAAGS